MTALVWQSPADLRGMTAPRVPAGDLVRTGEYFHPHYQVVALSEDRARIRDTQHGMDHVVPLDRCAKIPGVIECN